MSASPGFNSDLSANSQSDLITSKHVILVNHDVYQDRLIDLIETLGMACTVLPSYLSALGELSKHPAKVVIGPANVWRGSLHTIVDGAHAICPGVKLLAIADSSDDEHVREAMAAGFDAVLNPPFELESLQRLLLDASERASVPQPAAESHTHTEQTVQSEDEVPGDVDLIDAILSPDKDMRDVAIRMIESISGLRGVGVRPADGQPPEGDACVDVLYRGKSLGRLHAAPPATEDQLYAWADWLARWLAMDNQFAELSTMALKDELTGVWNRRYFNRFLERIIQRAAVDRSHITLLVFDIDDFKLYNDKYGHGTGDDVLREAARLMQSVVREHDVVARIGGDEFAVIFWDNEKPRKPNSEHPQDVVTAARRFQEAICAHRFPKLLDKAVGRLTVSGGLASFPWDGRTPKELLARADAMALQSKRQGKNAITFGTGAKRSKG